MGASPIILCLLILFSSMERDSGFRRSCQAFPLPEVIIKGDTLKEVDHGSIPIPIPTVRFRSASR